MIALIAVHVQYVLLTHLEVLSYFANNSAPMCTQQIVQVHFCYIV